MTKMNRCIKMISSKLLVSKHEDKKIQKVNYPNTSKFIIRKTIFDSIILKLNHHYMLIGIATINRNPIKTVFSFFMTKKNVEI